jgi:hypothetical protein
MSYYKEMLCSNGLFRRCCNVPSSGALSPSLDKERFSASFDEANTLKHNHFMRTICEFKELEVLEKKFGLYNFRFQYTR